MSRFIQKIFFAIGLFILLLTGGGERLTNHPPAIASQAVTPTAESKLPAGVERSDWQGILAAHEEWKHTIREAPDGAQGWQAENAGSGLRVAFDGRGGVVRSSGGDWHWGLELEGYGIGRERRSVAERTPQVGTSGRRIGYDWDGNLEEWYQNRADGLEHGYTIRERLGRPGEEAPLEVWLKVRGGLAEVEIDGDGRGASFGRERGEALLRYAGLKVWDAAGREVAARLQTAGPGELRLVVEEQTASYPLTIDPTIMAQQAYLKASNTGGADNFGISVAISGETVVVGAPSEASNATGVNMDQTNNLANGSGAAYVFVRSGGTWSQQAYLKASNTNSWDWFGWSVAISGETVVVGAAGEDSNSTGVNGDQTNNLANGSGAAYVFVRSEGTWSQQAYLKASNTDAYDEFGISVAISGETVVVGAPDEDSNATGVNGDQTNNISSNRSGAVYVYVRSGTSWSQQAYLKASNADAEDFFGRSVAISGETVVVGADGEASNTTGGNWDQTNNLASGSGAAYVFVRLEGVWTQQAYLKASNTEAQDYFGRSVAISGETVVVGAYGEASNATGVNGDQTNNSTPWSGAAYVFVRSGTVWSQQAYLKASNSDTQDKFGLYVAISGETVVVGAHVESSNATGVNGDQTNNSAGFSGAAYVFVRNGTSWSQLAYLKGSNTESDDYFGWSLATFGQTVVVGAPFEDSNATGVNGDQTIDLAPGSGAAYVYKVYQPDQLLLAIYAGNAQSVTVGTTVPIAPSVLVRDAQNNPVPGVPVTFAIASGGGSLSGASAITNASGIATVGSWTLGTLAGVNTLTATVTGLSGSLVTFTATGTVGAATQIAINAGNNQMVTAGTAVSVPPSVVVRDAFGNLVAGIQVTFAISSGGGSLTGAEATTNGSGIATVGSWTLGTVAGVNTLIVSIVGVVGFPVTFTATGTVGAAAQMAINAGNNQMATVGTAVSVLPSVLVRDAVGNPVAGIPVAFAIVSGGGSLTEASAITNGSGIATVGSWTLGSVAGVNTLAATSAALAGSPMLFTATATAGLPTQVAISSGNNQTVTAGSAVPIAPSVLVRDVNNNPVPGVPVAFAIASGGGSVIGASATTNGSGIATVGSWTLGTVAGVNTLTASVVGLSGSSVTFTATGTAGAVAQMAIVAGNEQTTSAGAPVPVAPSVLVRDVHQNPVPDVPVTFAIASGGGSLTGASVTTNGSGIATVGSWTLGTAAGPNVLTAATAGVAFTAVATPGTVPGVPAIGTPGGAEIGPGSTVTITQTLANPTATPTDSTYQATLPNGLFALSCTAPFGTCAIGAGSLIGSGEGDLQRVAATTASAANRTVAWAGTIPGGGSVAITYQVQVGVQASNGVQQCVTSTISGFPGPQTCLAVSVPPAGPGNLPIAAGLPNPLKPGSVLIFNVYTSSVSRSQSDSQISLTNTNPVNAAYVHLFFIDGSNCAVADRVVTLTQNQTVSFLASDFDPGVTGYLIAVAVDRNGCPVIGNYLVGGSAVRFESGHHASLSAIGISGLVQSPPLCNPNATTTTLAFNGVAYDELPRTLTAYTLPSLANGNSPLLIVNRIGGDLTSGAATIGGLAGLLFDDSEAARSFSINGGTCQLRGLLGNNFPRTVPRYTTVIPAGRTGWMKFWSVEDEAISGVLINESLSGLSGGYNLPVLTTTSSATLTIPVVPAG